MFTKFHNFEENIHKFEEKNNNFGKILKTWKNFKIMTKVHSFDQILQCWPNLNYEAIQDMQTMQTMWTMQTTCTIKADLEKSLFLPIGQICNPCDVFAVANLPIYPHEMIYLFHHTKSSRAKNWRKRAPHFYVSTLIELRRYFSKFIWQTFTTCTCVWYE